MDICILIQWKPLASSFNDSIAIRTRAAPVSLTDASSSSAELG